MLGSCCYDFVAITCYFYCGGRQRFRQCRDVREVGKRDLRLDHPELGEVAAGVRVLRAEGRPEGVDLGQREAARSSEGEIVCWGQNANPAPRIHRKQVTGVATDDHVGPTGRSQRQVLVVLWIVALPHGFSRLDPLSRNDDNVEDPLAPLNGDEAVELWAKDHLAVLVLDRPREDKPVGWIDGALQGSLREAV